MTCREEILTAARRINDRSDGPEFTIQEIINEMRRSGSRYPDSTIRTHITSLMCVNAPRHHAVAYDDLVRVDRGRYRRASATGGSSSGAPRRIAPPPRLAAPAAGRVRERVDRLITDFPRYVNAFDARPAFTRPDQLRLHLETIRRRRALRSAGAAVDDDRFLDLLRDTLKAWGIGVRRSRLADHTGFKAALHRQRAAIDGLDGQLIDDPNLAVREITRAAWDLIRDLQIVDNKAPLVAGSKALHHLLPDLVVPIDREYTRRFFGWGSPQFQYHQEAFFGIAFEQFASVARAADPQSYLGAKWRSSRTKVLDNAIVAFCRIEGVPRYGG